MSVVPQNQLYKKVAEKGFVPAHVAEVGVWHPEGSNVYAFIQDGVRTTLVEPDPESIRLLKDAFGDMANVALHEVAACDVDGEIELYKRGSSTFVSTLPNSPALVNDDCDVRQTETFKVTGKVFDDIDDGTIDLISVDTEGSEWVVIKHLKSRPAVISVETHGGMYVNPYLEQLIAWMANHGYVLWYKDKSDSVYAQPDRIAVSLRDTMLLSFTNVYLELRSRRKKLKRRLKKLFKMNAP